jgi:hypothetical protein
VIRYIIQLNFIVATIKKNCSYAVSSSTYRNTYIKESNTAPSFWHTDWQTSADVAPQTGIYKLSYLLTCFYVFSGANLPFYYFCAPCKNYGMGVKVGIMLGSRHFW